MLKVQDVAEYFLSLAGTGIDHMKLQKLCYLAQAYHLAMYGGRLFDGAFRAFKWGPVSEQLWRQHRYTPGLIRPTGAPPELEESESSLLEAVFARYGHHSGMELSRITHRDGPFKVAWARALAHESDVIDDEALAELYSARLTLLDTSEAPAVPDPDELRTIARGNEEIRKQSWAGFEESQRRGLAV